MSACKLRPMMAGFVLLHLAVVSLHGFSHHRLRVDLESCQAVFVGILIVAGPLVAFAALWAFRPEVGPILLAFPWLPRRLLESAITSCCRLRTTFSSCNSWLGGIGSQLPQFCLRSSQHLLCLVCVDPEMEEHRVSQWMRPRE